MEHLQGNYRAFVEHLPGIYGAFAGNLWSIYRVLLVNFIAHITFKYQACFEIKNIKTTYHEVSIIINQTKARILFNNLPCLVP